MKLYTSYFAKQKKMPLEDASYVSIAVGNPRYSVPYKIVNANALKPYGVFRKYHGEEYKIKYFERLESFGVEEIRKELEKVSEGHENVILMCHEKDKNQCHRVMFAEWWERKTGEKIEEYGEQKNEKPKIQSHQLSIFSLI